jgi:hypothetical protein
MSAWKKNNQILIKPDRENDLGALKAPPRLPDYFYERTITPSNGCKTCGQKK